MSANFTNKNFETFTGIVQRDSILWVASMISHTKNLGLKLDVHVPHCWMTTKPIKSCGATTTTRRSGYRMKRHTRNYHVMSTILRHRTHLILVVHPFEATTLRNHKESLWDTYGIYKNV
jgi:hypothetical protein